MRQEQTICSGILDATRAYFQVMVYFFDRKQELFMAEDLIRLPFDAVISVLDVKRHDKVLLYNKVLHCDEVATVSKISNVWY